MKGRGLVEKIEIQIFGCDVLRVGLYIILVHYKAKFLKESFPLGDTAGGYLIGKISVLLS